MRQTRIRRPSSERASIYYELRHLRADTGADRANLARHELAWLAIQAARRAGFRVDHDAFVDEVLVWYTEAYNMVFPLLPSLSDLRRDPSASSAVDCPCCGVPLILRECKDPSVQARAL